MWMFYISGLYDLCEDGLDKATNDMPEDFQILGLMVCFCLNILSEFFLLILILAGV